MQKKLFNPKSQAPAVFIANWLIQVPVKLLSFGAKILYGRLVQWSSEDGKVFRSYPQLAQEIGVSKRTICDLIKELKDVELIGTYQPQAGGMNHFEFYEHPWMYDPIKKELCYKNDPSHNNTKDPTQNSALPHAEFCSTPTQDPARINIKEIKEINNNIYTRAEDENLNSSVKQNQYQETYYQEPLIDPDESPHFKEFWDAYPIKKQKSKTRVAWDAQSCDDNSLEIMHRLREQIAKDADFLNGYAPNPFTYITQERWTDELKLQIKKPCSKSRIDLNSREWGKSFDTHLF